jgi:hypothetical protein
VRNSTLEAPKAFYDPPRLPSDGVLGKPRERVLGKIIPCRIEFVGKKTAEFARVLGTVGGSDAFR